MRRPTVAGQFYAADEATLRGQIEKCFMDPLGPGKLPALARGSRSILGGVVPHAGYMYSGAVAANFYGRLAEDGFPRTFIIIGPNHTGRGSGLAVATDDFQTPLGIVHVDRELAKEVRRDIVDEDSEAHKFEHSIEVQLPFLQYFSNDFELVPICMGIQDYDSAASLGKTIRGAVKGKDVVVIASTDLSHYVPKDIAKKKDTMVLDAIKAMDAKSLFRAVKEHNISMCGYGPVIATMTACSGGTARLLKYATSGDVTPMNEVVGYAAVVIGK
jgi:AmmeMemoRadiSam system protein B